MFLCYFFLFLSFFILPSFLDSGFFPVCLYFFNQKVHYRIHKLVSLNLILSHFKPLLIFTDYLSEIIFNVIPPQTNRLPGGSHHFRFCNYLFYVLLFSPSVLDVLPPSYSSWSIPIYNKWWNLYTTNLYLVRYCPFSFYNTDTTEHIKFYVNRPYCYASTCIWNKKKFRLLPLTIFTAL